MMTLPPQPTETLILTQEEWDILHPPTPLPADLREQMRAALYQLPDVARAVYPDREIGRAHV